MQDAEVLRFSTAREITYEDLLCGRVVRDLDIFGYLYMPKAASAGIPVVAISVGSLGFSSGREELYARALTDVGIGALVVDGYSTRGISETATGQGQLSMAASCCDALTAVAMIQDHPNVDPTRIGIMGYSRGGQVATAACHRRLQARVLEGAHPVAAHLALYPSMLPCWRVPEPTAAPLLFLIPADDDLAPPAKSMRYAEAVAKAGGTIETRSYENARHAFDSLVVDQTVNTLNLNDCAMMIESDGRVVEDLTGVEQRGSWAEFLLRLESERGRTLGTLGNAGRPRERAVADVQDFFQRVLSRG